MPPTRRTSTAARRNQATLSFGSKSRVTKPTTQPQKQKNLDPVTSIAPEKPSVDTAQAEQVPVTPTEPSHPHVAELAVRQQAKSEVQQPWTEEDEKASKITEKDLQRYWKQEEQKRKVARVHQEGLDLHEKILRHFDLSSQYGPCIGIARLKRWRRANMLDLHPPLEVLAVLLNGKGDVKERAYVDELMS